MSAPMLPFAAYANKLYKYLTSESNRAAKHIDIPSVQIQDVETAAEKRPRTLKHLLKANHSNFAVFFHNLQFDNHMPHILCSAYLLGASADQLNHIYVEESKQLEAWKDSPAEITEHDWRDFLGDRRYQRAYVDFFEDELALKFSYDWKMVAEEYLFSGRNPLINCVISGLGHPLIHLGYAYEFSSREIGMEALGIIASAYNFLHKYIDDPSYTKQSTYSSTSPLEILHRIAEDTKLDGVFEHKAGDNLEVLFRDHESIVMEYWNAWSIEDPLKDFERSQQAAVALLVSTGDYDFFLLHLLTTSHAVRILLPFVPQKFHINLVRQWWLITVAVYISQLRPKIDEIKTFTDKNWKYAEEKAISGPWATDAHYVKGIRAIKEAAATWGDEEGRYVSSAVKFADEFNGWQGFGPHEVSEVAVN